MKVEARIFEIIAGFFFVCAIFYAWLAKESVGIVGLTLTGGLALIIGTYFRFISRRLEGRPEDESEAEVSDGAGELGFFSPGSYWPAALGASAALTAVTIAYWLPWAIIIAVAILLIVIGGLLFEYHLPPSGH
jgi:hypothetical protein